MNTKDFANKSTAVKTRGASLVGSHKKLWAVTISFGIIGLVGILWLQQIKHTKNADGINQLASISQNQNKPVGPNYEFYKTLEKGEVRMLEEEGHLAKVEETLSELISQPPKLEEQPKVVDNAEIKKEHKLEQKIVAKNSHKNKVIVKEDAVKDHKQYTLQLGSFKKYPEADELKARLALQGQELLIETVVLADGQKWYRVKSKPMNSYQLAIKERERLSKAHVNSMIMQSSAVG